MSTTIKFLTDTTCDLPEELLDELQVEAVPLHVLLGGKDHLDGVDVTREELYDYANRTRELPKTAAVSELQFVDAFKRAFANGAEHIIYTGISSKISATLQNAALAKQDLAEQGMDVSNIHLIDSLQLSTGSAHLLFEGVEMAKKGIEPEEIVRRLEAYKARLSTSFVVDTLTYLHMGGRCSSLAYVAGSMLRLHPQIDMKDGSLQAGEKFRGSIYRALEQYQKKMVTSRLDTIDNKRIFITQTMTDFSYAQEAKRQIESLGYFENVYVTYAGATISSHCGPNTLGYLYAKKA